MRTALMERLGVRYPLIQAPMAGGLSTPALVAAVSQAGGLGSIGAAYLTARELDEEVADIRRRTDEPFAINLFAYKAQEADAQAAARIASLLEKFRDELKVPAESARPPPSSRSDRFEQVLRIKPAVFSFTFGIPSKEELQALRKEQIAIVGTATNLAEAQALEEAGVDAISAQGAEAGGHRGTFIGTVEEGLVPLLELVARLVKQIRAPTIAAGGMMDGLSIAAALKAGAQAVQLGTAFLDTPEAGTAPAYRRALTSGPGRDTVITRAYSGRYARAIRNRFTDAFSEVPVPPFPQQQALTNELRRAAAAQSRTDLMQMLVGEGAPRVRQLPAGELVRALMSEAGIT